MMKSNQRIDECSSGRNIIRSTKVRAMEIIDEHGNKNEVFTVEPLDILDLMEILIPVLQSGPSYLKIEKDMCRQEQESSMTLFQRKNLWRQRIKH